MEKINHGWRKGVKSFFALVFNAVSIKISFSISDFFSWNSNFYKVIFKKSNYFCFCKAFIDKTNFKTCIRVYDVRKKDSSVWRNFNFIVVVFLTISYENFANISFVNRVIVFWIRRIKIAFKCKKSKGKLNAKY